jgi:large subunit ribosomal protein L9
MKVRVYLKKDVEKIGLSGEIIEVKEGFAFNYLIPQGIGIVVDKNNQKFFKTREKAVEHRKEVIATQTSMLAQKISSLDLVIKKKMHDDGKLYGAVNASDIADVLVEKGITVAKNQVIINKTIKTKGSYEVTIKLSSRLQPKIKVTVLPE